MLSFIDRNAVKHAANFAPLLEKEMWAYWGYQISNIAIFVYICFLKVIADFSWKFYIGMALYILGLALCTISVINFAKPSGEGLNTKGIYNISRNPMYVAYFIYFMACVLLTRSILLCVLVLIFQFASHWIILSEERWCIDRFGDTYKQYMKKVRRYLLRENTKET